MQLEQAHNIVHETLGSNADWEIEYDSGPFAEVIARCIVDINSKTTAEGLRFAQQHLLTEGLRHYCGPCRHHCSESLRGRDLKLSSSSCVEFNCTCGKNVDLHCGPSVLFVPLVPLHTTG